MRLLTGLLFFLVTVSPLFAASPTYLVIGTNTRWQGEVVLDQPLLVAAGAVLEIAPGTQIRSNSAVNAIRIEGALLAIGTQQQPIVFTTPADWVGIELTQSVAESRFDYVQFRDAATAISSVLSRFHVSNSQFENCDIAIILHRQSQPLIEDTTFSSNRIGIDIEMRSQVTLRRNQFVKNETAVLASHNSSGEIIDNLFTENEQGVHLQHLFPGTVAGNRFEKNSKALLCDQTMESPIILTNEFIDNQQGLITLLASKPLVRNNRFSGNQQALVSNQLGSPRVEQNLFVGNRIAINSERRSAPQIELNQFADNDLALHCDYLSYPVVRQNNFTQNRLSVKLGEHQSAAMEKQGKSQQEVQDFLAKSGRAGKMAVFTPISGVVDVRQNWWGESSVGASRSDLFFDREQSKWVLDGASGERYLRDRIEFSPWLQAPVVNAGIE